VNPLSSAPGTVQTPGYSLPVPVEQTTVAPGLYLDLLKRSLTGGYRIVDDFGSHQSQAGQAILDYRKKHGIDEEIVDIDGSGAYWRRKA
jgi:hypothetical protein